MRGIGGVVVWVLLGVGCVEPVDPVAQRACQDNDGDGVSVGDCDDPELAAGLAPEAVDLRDCNDDPDRRGALESPLLTEIPYDGLDNDCSSMLDGADHDIVDVDGDGFPGILKADWEALRNSEYYLWSTDISPDRLDCNDSDPDLNPAEVERWYDGIDADCAGDNDFDADGDGYIEDAWVGMCEAAVAAGHPGPCLPGDCDDANPDHFPGAEDPPGDGVDADCDGEA